MLLDILEDHLDEAVHLFSRRQLAFDMLDMTGEDLAELDERLRAHLEGLLLGGEDAWNICRDHLAGGAVDEAFVAGIVALEGGDPSRLQAVEQAMACENPEIKEGVVWACCLTVWPGIAGFLLKHVQGEDASIRAAALQALVFRRIDPGPALERALREDGDPGLAPALRGAGVFRKAHLVNEVEKHATSKDHGIRAAALESLVLLDPERGRRICIADLAGEDPCPWAAGLLGVVGRPGDVQALITAVSSRSRPLEREALLTLGNLGFVSTVPTLIRMLDSSDLSGVAGVALRRIFGKELPADEAPPPPTPSEDEETPEDEDWTPDDDLPRYSSEAIRSWWPQKQSDYDEKTRYRDGGPVGTVMLTGESSLFYRRLDAFEVFITGKDGFLMQTAGASQCARWDAPDF